MRGQDKTEFAAAGLIATMLLQRKDLKLQRESLNVQKEELTRNTSELALQREEFKTQNRTIKLQRFENTFFNMLSLQQEITSALVYVYIKKTNSGERGQSAGREVFGAMYKDARLTVNISNKTKISDSYGIINYLSDKGGKTLTR